MVLRLFVGTRGNSDVTFVAHVVFVIVLADSYLLAADVAHVVAVAVSIRAGLTVLYFATAGIAVVVVIVVCI